MTQPMTKTDPAAGDPRRRSREMTGLNEQLEPASRRNIEPMVSAVAVAALLAVTVGLLAGSIADREPIAPGEIARQTPSPAAMIDAPAPVGGAAAGAGSTTGAADKDVTGEDAAREDAADGAADIQAADRVDMVVSAGDAGGIVEAVPFEYPYPMTVLESDWDPHGDVPAQVEEILAKIQADGVAMVDQWLPVACQKYAPVFDAAGLPRWMAVVAWRESRCVPTARNLDLSTADDSWGLFQINTLGYLWEEVEYTCGIEQPDALLDAATNIACAGRLHARYGFRPWHAGKYFQ